MLTAAEYTRARTAYQANLAAAVARMVGILTTDPEEEAPMKQNTKTRYRVTRTITYLEVVDVLADSKVAARRMVEAGHFTPRRVRMGNSDYTVTEQK